MSDCIRSIPCKKPYRGNYSHGMSGTPFFNRFNTLKQRTSNPNSHKYHMYGARGILCEWESFEQFMTDMYKSYLEHATAHGERNTTIERVNNEGNYSKKNCRWATPLEQAHNTRNVVRHTHKGVTKCRSEWEREFGVSQGLIGYHINKGKTFKQIIKLYNYAK